MKITVVGAGCPSCQSLYDRVKKMKEEKNIQAEVEYKNDINELTKRGIMSSPALLIDDEPVYVGMPKNDEELLKLIQK